VDVPLIVQCKMLNLPEPEEEYTFHPERGWRFDLAWPALRVAVEVEGGLYLPGGGRHNRGKGYENDCEKYSEASILGWVLVRVTYKMIRHGKALALIEKAVRCRQSKESQHEE